jgi:hypothetical protein
MKTREMGDRTKSVNGTKLAMKKNLMSLYNSRMTVFKKNLLHISR